MLWAAALLVLAVHARPVLAVELTRMRALASDALAPPADGPGWIEVALPGPVAPPPGLGSVGAAWYRGSFQGPASSERSGTWAVYLPYLYEGGQVWLNGTQVGEVEEDSDAFRVRWERPHLVTLPQNLLRAGDNELSIRAAGTSTPQSRRFPAVSVAPRAELLSAYDARLFWVRTAPLITVVVCFLMAAIVLCIWWRRRSEVLYGLFGLASALWGVRTLTFVIERMPTPYWHLWRTVYLGATCGFVVVLAPVSYTHLTLPTNREV